MGAKETVIKLNRGGILSDIEVDSYNNGAEAQAPISFKAGLAEGDKERYDIGVSDGRVGGVAEGIREVVEFIRGNIYGRVVDKEHIHKLRVEIPLIDWEAKLKEWGL